MADDPGTPTVFGWDASDYDWNRGPMDLAAGRRDGIDFFTHKATEATWTKHTHFGEAMRRARDAGIPILGAYHVVRSPANAAAEVDYCLAYVDAVAPWWRDWPHWFWQIDLEKWSYDAVPAAEGEAFADIIEARTGRKAVIYASRGQYGDQLAGTSHELWNANYGANPDGHYRTVYAARGGDSGPGWVTYSGRMPIFWQFGSRTTIGTQNICDANAFRGTLEQLRALITGVEVDELGTVAETITWEIRPWLADVHHAATRLEAAVAAIAAKVDISVEELEAIKAAAAEGARAGVAETVTAETIAAAIPDDVAEQVVELLAARLARSAQ